MNEKENSQSATVTPRHIFNPRAMPLARIKPRPHDRDPGVGHVPPLGPVSLKHNEQMDMLARRAGIL